MPPVDAGNHLISILFDVGPAVPVGMGGMIGVGERDMLAWQQNRGIKLTIWEIDCVKHLSHCYAAQLADAREKDCPPPWINPSYISPERREKINNAMKDWASKFNATKKRS